MCSCTDHTKTNENENDTQFLNGSGSRQNLANIALEGEVGVQVWPQFATELTPNIQNILRKS